ncbi:hypothetical protein D3C72_1203650 [compost metagenome]
MVFRQMLQRFHAFLIMSQGRIVLLQPDVSHTHNMFIGSGKEIQVLAANVEVFLRSVGQVNHFPILLLIQSGIGLLLAH